MKITLSQLRKIIRETLDDIQKCTCRVCGGTGEVAGEFCATCGGEGEELNYSGRRPGIGRGPLPWGL